MFDAYGLERIKTSQIEDFVGLLRRIWRGETVIQHDGPCGSYPYLSMGAEYKEHIPMTFTAFGPNSLALGGRAFDAVVLHTFFTEETTRRCVLQVKEAAEQAGGPDSPGGVSQAGGGRAARVLLEAGATVDLLDNEGTTALRMLLLVEQT